MALPEPESLVKAHVPKCCADPELKKWLDALKALRDDGQAIPSAVALSVIARENGHDIGRSTIKLHLRGECGAS